MPQLVGLRVVRGRDWKWGDQDGGEGCVGTVIPSPPSDINHLGPRTITVLWDSGMKSTYQGGPTGSHHLRAIDNTTLGVKHPNIPCGDDSCWVQEILGTRWQCTTCGINLCTNCFLKKRPHSVEHVHFKRFTINEQADAKPLIVRCWGADGPDSRIELKGFYPGAAVSMGPDWPYRREGEKKSGLVVAAPKEEVYGRILVEWQPSNERTRHQRSDSEGHSVLKLKEPGIGGFYYPEAFADIEIPVPEVNPRPLALFFGDRVQIDPSMKTDDFRRKQIDHGGYIDGMKELVGTIGTVQFMDGSSVNVKFKTRYGGESVSWRFNPTIFKKLNKFSVNQVIRIRNDAHTLRSIESKYENPEIHQKLVGATGRITEVNEDDPDRLYVHFDCDEIYYWLSKNEALPSGWMELVESATEPAVEKTLAELIEKMVSLFINAIDRGDLRTAKLLHLHHTVVTDARNADGKTALQIACLKGYKEMVKWLIDEVKVDVEKPSSKTGFRAIHYAVHSCNPEILELLIERRVNLDSQIIASRGTALHIAMSKQYTECGRLLVRGGCDANLQDFDGNTPLHIGMFYKNGHPCVIDVLSHLSINFEVRNKIGFNVFHFAVVMDDLKAIELMMGKENIEVPLLELMPQSKSTVLHYACTHKNYQVAKLLVDNSKNKVLPDGSSLLKKLLEVKNESGMTALLIACQLKNHALIELLVEAGADLNAVDLKCQTAILLVAISSAAEEIPTMDLAPAIFKVYQNINNDSNMKLMVNKTILTLIAYLINKGCDVDSVNKAGLKLSDILLMDNCYPKDILEILKEFNRKHGRKEPSAGAGGCMGRAGCTQQPEFKLSCPHKAIYKACSKCFLPTVESFKCGCPDEKIVSIPITASSSSVENTASMDGAEVKEEQISYEFKWISDGSKNGKVEDQIGNEYIWSGTRKDGAIGYRCTSVSVLGRKGRCTAVARRFIKSSKNGTDTIQLESQHKHPAVKRKADSVDDQEGNELMPMIKRERRSVGADK